MVIAVMTFALAGRSRATWVRAAIASLPPFLFLCLIANDTSRWTMLASFNAWLVLISLHTASDTSRGSGILAPLAAVAFLLLTHPKPDKMSTRSMPAARSSNTSLAG